MNGEPAEEWMISAKLNIRRDGKHSHMVPTRVLRLIRWLISLNIILGIISLNIASVVRYN